MKMGLYCFRWATWWGGVSCEMTFLLRTDVHFPLEVNSEEPPEPSGGSVTARRVGCGPWRHLFCLWAWLFRQESEGFSLFINVCTLSTLTPQPQGTSTPVRFFWSFFQDCQGCSLPVFGLLSIIHASFCPPVVFINSCPSHIEQFPKLALYITWSDLLHCQIYSY